MAVIRMNDEHRKALWKLAQEKVRCPVEAEVDKTTYKKAEKAVTAVLRAAYPAKDMKVLEKYSLAGSAREVRLQLTAGGVVEFKFRDPKTAPLIQNHLPYGKIFATNEVQTQAVEDSIQAYDAYRQALKAKLEDYKALIWSSTNLDHIEKVWPEASELRLRIDRHLPMVLSADVISRIKADVASRVAA